MELNKENLQNIAEQSAKNIGRLIAWQLQDKLNASMQVSGKENLPKIGQLYVRNPTDDEVCAGIRAIVIRKVNARYWLRIVIG